MDVQSVYRSLLKHFGHQSWWSCGRGFSPREWEICLGAVLTQNTNWRNVELALENLRGGGCLSPEDILRAPKKTLEQLIRPSGFYKQKAERLRIFSAFVLGFGSVKRFLRHVSRQELLGLKGIGPETADSILLYAGNRPFFVVDMYTKRLFQRLGLGNPGYRGIQEMVAGHIPKSGRTYKEFHALIVEHSKKYCRKKPRCSGCPLVKACRHKT